MGGQNDKYSIADLQEEVVRKWDMPKLLRLRSLIDTEMLQRLMAGRQKRKSSGANDERSN